MNEKYSAYALNVINYPVEHASNTMKFRIYWQNPPIHNMHSLLKRYTRANHAISNSCRKRNIVKASYTSTCVRPGQ